MAAFCHNCGAPLIEGAAYCSACGTSVAPTQQTASPPSLQPSLREAFTSVRPPEPVRKSRVGALLLLGSLLILLVIWAISDSSSKRPTASTEPVRSEPAQSSPIPAEESAVNHPHHVGEEFSVGYWTYRCYGIRWQPAILTGFESFERADAAFLIVDLSIRNNDTSSSVLPPVKLVDTQGRLYDESSKATFMPGAFDVFKKLNPEVSSRGLVVFDVPRGVYSLKLSGGFESGEYSLVDLSTPEQENEAAKPSATGTPPVTASSDSTIAVPSQGQNPVAAVDQPAPQVENTKCPQILGFSRYRNEKFGFTLEYPQFFVAHSPQTTDEVMFISPDGKSQLIVSGHNNTGLTVGDYLRRAVAADKVLYEEAGDNWLSVTWRDGKTRGYLKMFVGQGSVNSLETTFPESWRPEYDSVIDRMERSFKPGEINRSR